MIIFFIKVALRNFKLLRNVFSLYGKRISLNRDDPNKCAVTFQNALDTDIGNWNILTTLCSRGRGKNTDQTIVTVYEGNILSYSKSFAI